MRVFIFTYERMHASKVFFVEEFDSHLERGLVYSALLENVQTDDKEHGVRLNKLML